MIREPRSNAASYIYCVGYAEPFRSGEPLTTPGIGGRGDVVRLVEHADLVALVSDSPKMRYDISRRNLTAHQAVLEEAMRRSTVLPVSFGTVANSDDDVRDKLLKRELDELHRNLEYVRDRVELTVIALWNREQLFAEIVAENDDIQALRDSLAGLPEDTAYYERIELGQLTEAAVSRKSDEEARRIMAGLAPLAVDTRLNENLSDMMLLNAAFLVDRAREEAFDAAMHTLGEAESGRLIFKYVGPLAPHSFVSVSVNLED